MPEALILIGFTAGLFAYLGILIIVARFMGAEKDRSDD